MSKNLPEQQPAEEVDLGQLFKLIGNMFDRLFKFIGGIFNKLFLAFVWLVFFVKKHFIKFVIAGVLGVGYGFINNKVADPTYKSTAVLKQNYKTGENLYTLLDYYNELITQGDSTILGNVLKISPSKAANLASFEIESILNDNQKLKLFDNYTKELDSTLAKTVNYKDFLQNSDEFNHQYQRITLKATSNKAFNEVFQAIADNLESSSFFKNKQRKDREALNRTEALIIESLKESDSLQSVYMNVLENSVDNSGAESQTSITIDNTEDKSVTKEFELYNNDLQLRRELASIRSEKEDITNIIEIVSMQQSEGTVDKSFNLLGFKTDSKILIGVLFAFVAFLILLFIEFINYLERYKDKI